MIAAWIIIWLVYNMPAVTVEPRLNGWAIALIVCAILDVLR